MQKLLQDHFSKAHVSNIYLCPYDGKVMAQMLTSLAPQSINWGQKASWYLEQMKSTADQVLGQNIKFKIKKHALERPICWRVEEKCWITAA